MTKDQKKRRILKQHYFNAAKPSAYSGANKLFRILNKKYPGLFTLSYIKNWLSSVDAYSVSKQSRKRFPTPKILVTGIDELWEIDLTNVERIAKENSNVKYLMFTLDAFSRYLWIKPLSDRKGQTILKALQEIIRDSGRKPTKLRSDKGSEFVNDKVKTYLKQNNIYFYTTNNVVKASLVERVQRTFKQMLWRYMRHQRSNEYIDILEDLVANYNASPHKSLNFMSPGSVTKANEADLFAFMYLSKSKHMKKKNVQPFRFDIGDYVRLSYLKHPFRKSYDQTFTSELFIISKKWRIQGINVYNITGWDKSLVKGQFYEAELTKVDSSAENQLFYVEKTLKKKKVGSKVYHLVKWEGYPSSMNSWIPASDIKTVK